MSYIYIHNYHKHRKEFRHATLPEKKRLLSALGIPDPATMNIVKNAMNSAAKPQKERPDLTWLTNVAAIAIVVSSFTLPITSTIGVLILFIIIRTIIEAIIILTAT